MHLKSCQRTRLAPTPSGFLHLGNVFSFSVTVALAHRYGASVLLRIDDMDTARVVPEYFNDVFNSLTFLGIPWEEGPKGPEEHLSLYAQRHRSALYESALKSLSDYGRVFACRCSRSSRRDDSTAGCLSDCRLRRMPLDTPGTAWRLDTSQAGSVTMETLHGSRKVSFPVTMDDFVVRRKDGLPAYQLCSLVDDVHFGVNLVVRGNDLRASTIAQLYLAGLLGFDGFLKTTFFHHILIADPSGGKLSKSAGSLSVQHLISQGWSPEQVTAAAASAAGCGKLRRWQDFMYIIDQMEAEG